jgi:aquaporin Z
MKFFSQYFAEFIGTFALVFCGTGAIIANEYSGGQIGALGIAVTFGAIVMAIIYSIGEKSGAHINPAVTIAFWVSGRFPLKGVLPYVAAQTVGALLASLTLVVFFPDSNTLGETLPSIPPTKAFGFELILTFLLMFVIIQVSTGSKEVGTLAGIAIGAVVLLEATFAGPITGASMNPARSIAPALISGNLQHLWIYVAGPVLGACMAIGAWKILQISNSKA